jgi:predicted N-acetyltransferase YhbS
MSFEDVRRLWSATYAPEFEIDERIWTRNVIQHPTLAEFLDDDHAVAAIKSTRFEYGGDENRFHLAAFAYDDRAAGQALLKQVTDWLAQQGASVGGPVSLTFGQDSDHIWPGVPLDHAELTDLLSNAGFTTGGEVVDLQRDLAGYEPRDSGCEAPEYRVATGADEAAMFEYFDREFPGRWRFDVMQQFFEDPARVFLWAPDGEVHGHALIQQDGTDHPIGGAVWRTSLGPNWGALGSIGVSVDRRGGGSGGRLLDAALFELSRRGCRETIIDWTGIAALYEKYGFEIRRRYYSATFIPPVP